MNTLRQFNNIENKGGKLLHFIHPKNIDFSRNCVLANIQVLMKFVNSSKLINRFKNTKTQYVINKKTSVNCHRLIVIDLHPQSWAESHTYVHTEKFLPSVLPSPEQHTICFPFNSSQAIDPHPRTEIANTEF